MSLPPGFEAFAYHEASEPTILWLRAVLERVRVESELLERADQLATRLLGAADPVVAWHETYDYDLHAIQRIERAERERFAMGEFRSVPYLCRYPGASRHRAVALLVRRALDEEIALGGRGEITLIGRRIVASAVAFGSCACGDQ